MPLSNRRKRNYWPRLLECFLVAGLSYVIVVSLTRLLDGYSYHSWKAAIRSVESHLGHASSLKSGASGAGQPEMAIFNARRPSRDSQKIESDQCLADRDCAFSTISEHSNAIKRA